MPSVSGGILPTLPEDEADASGPPPIAPALPPRAPSPLPPAPSQAGENLPDTAPDVTAPTTPDPRREQMTAALGELWKHNGRQNLKAALLNWKGFATRRNLSVPDGADAAEYVRDSLIDAYLQLDANGKPAPTDALERQFRCDEIAIRRFNGNGLGNPDAFFKQLQWEASRDLLLKPKPDAELADKLSKALIGAKLYQSVTSAATHSPDPQIYRNADGTWDMPMITQDGVLKSTASVDQMMGSRLKNAGFLTDKRSIQEFMWKFQDDHRLSDEEMRGAWSDVIQLTKTFEPHETDRVLRDGTLIPNSANSDWLDDAKAQAIIDGSKASPAAKALARLNLPNIQREILRVKFDNYTAAAASFEASGALPATFVADKVLPDGFKLPMPPVASATDKVAMLEYERLYVNGAEGFKRFYWDARINGAIGLMTIASDLSGLASMMGSESAREFGGETSGFIAQATAGQTEHGFVGALTRQVAPLAFQILATRGAGLGAQGALRGTAYAANAAKAAQITRSFTAVSTAALTTAGSTYNQLTAAGVSEEEATKRAALVGLNTGIVVGIFGTGKFGGIENIAARSSTLTLGGLVQIARQEGIRDLAKSPQLREFATALILNAGGEATEEGITTLTNTFLAADSSTNVGTALDNALTASKHAFGITGIVHGISRIGPGPERVRPEKVDPAQPDTDTTSDTEKSADHSETSNESDAQRPLIPPPTDPTSDPSLVEAAIRQAKESGNIANVDDLRVLLPGYKESDTLLRDGAYTRSASLLNKAVIKHLLAQPPVTGDAIVLAGGGGSGKGTVMKSLKLNSDLIVDTTLSSPSLANDLLKEISDSGRRPAIVYIHRPFNLAMEGIIERYLEGKANGEPRLVPLPVAAKAHVAAQQTLLDLEKKGYLIEVYDNSGSKHSLESLDFLRTKLYANTHEPAAGQRLSDAQLGRNESASEEGNGRSLPTRGPRTRKEISAELRAAEERLTIEAKSIVERYRQAGKLTEREAQAFQGLVEDPK